MGDILHLHASCVAINGQGVLLVGASGAGKSDLALRLIDRGAQLVADDQVAIIQSDRKLEASVPEAIGGMLEVRGLGIFQFNYSKKITLSLVVALDISGDIERLPAPETVQYLGVTLPQIRLHGFEVSAAIKVEWALKALADGSLQVGFLRE